MRILIIFLILTTTASIAVAQSNVADWQLRFRYGAYLGTAREAVDTYDSSDVLQVQPSLINVATYHLNNVAGWNGPTGFYTSDFMAPLVNTAGSTKTWRIYTWADPALAQSSTVQDLICYLDGVPSSVFNSVNLTLTYIRSATGIADPWNEVGTTVLLNDYQDAYSIRLPVYRTTNGLDGYIFDLTATVVPEPATLLALAAGIASIALKRRR